MAAVVVDLVSDCVTVAQAFDSMAIYDFTATGVHVTQVAPVYGHGSTLPRSASEHIVQMMQTSSVHTEWRLLLGFVRTSEYDKPGIDRTELELTWPDDGVDVTFNEVRVPARRLHLFVDVSQAFRLRPSPASIMFSSAENRHLGGESGFTALFILAPLDIRAASGDVAHLPGDTAAIEKVRRAAEDETLAVAEAEAALDAGYASGDRRITLMCPITMCRITRPVKSRRCSHDRCFDFDTYIEMNTRSTSPEWRCPICTKPAPAAALDVDRFIATILADTSLHAGAEAVYVDAAKTRWWVKDEDIDEDSDTEDVIEI